MRTGSRAEAETTPSCSSAVSRTATPSSISAATGADPGDAFEFVGYGPGATFVQLDATHWQVNSGDGMTHETITLQNGAAVHASDVLFV